MSESLTPDQATAIIKAFIQAAAFDRDEEAVKKMVTKASAEQGNFSPPPDAHEMTITLDPATQEGEEWVVPLTITDPKDTSKPPMKMPMTLTVEEGQWKINMIRTMDRLFGGSMEAVMDGMVDALKGVGETMAEGLKQAFDGMGEAMSGAFQGSGDGTLYNRLPEDATADMQAIFDDFYNNELPDQLSLMREALGNELAINVDWSTFEGDTDSAAKLTRKVLHTLRSAICLSSSDDKIREALRGNLHEVLITHLNYPEGKFLSFDANRLHITTNLNDAGPAIGYHKSDEIIAALREALDADKGPAVDRLLAEVVPQLRDEVREHLDLDLDIYIQLASFIDAYDTDTAVRHLERLESDIFRNFVYFLREADKKVPLAGAIQGFRFEHVASAKFRALLAQGSLIIYRLCFTEENGYYDANDMEQILPGVVACLPDYSDPSAQGQDENQPISDDETSAFDLITQYRDRAFNDHRGKIQAAIGKGLDIEVDWASIGDDLQAAEQLRFWGLNRVVGAVRLAARDEQAQQDMIDTISGITLICVPTIDEKSIEFDAGILTLRLCLAEGERGCYYEHDIARALIHSLGSQFKPIFAKLRDDARYWEEQLADEHDAPVTYFIDFAGFTSSPEDQKNQFALSLLREHGIDVLYYAVTRLFEKNPNFAQQFRQRVRRFVVSHVSDPSLKRVGHLDDAIVYECYLHEGYKGYLTIDDLVKRLPGLVAEMSEFSAENSEDASGYDGATTTEQAELDAMAAVEDGMESDSAQAANDQGLTDDAGSNETAFAQMRTQIMNMLPNFSQQIGAMLGKPIPLTIDQPSLNGDAIALSLLINACLSPIFGAISALAQEPTYREGLVKYIDAIEMRRAESPEDQSIRLHEGKLTMSVFTTDADAPVMSAEEATSIFRGLIDYVRATVSEPRKTVAPKPRAKTTEKPSPKSAAKPAPKKAPAKKEPPKSKAKPAAKPTAKPKKEDKGKKKK